MTVKLVVLYTQPDDADAFDQHYAGTHMPLVDKIPGLQRTETGKVAAAIDGGEKTYYRVTELYFADQARSAGRVRLGRGQGNRGRLPADRAAWVADVPRAGRRLGAGRLSRRR